MFFLFASRELNNGRWVWFGLVWFGFITGQERIGIWGDTDTTQTQTEGYMTKKKGWAGPIQMDMDQKRRVSCSMSNSTKRRSICNVFNGGGGAEGGERGI